MVLFFPLSLPFLYFVSLALCAAMILVSFAVWARVRMYRWTAETVPPSVKAVNHVVGAPVESHVLLECIVEVFPKPLNGWYRNEGKQDIMPTNFSRLFSYFFFVLFSLPFFFFGFTILLCVFLTISSMLSLYVFTTCRLSLYHFEPISILHSTVTELT